MEFEYESSDEVSDNRDVFIQLRIRGLRMESIQFRINRVIT